MAVFLSTDVGLTMTADLTRYQQTNCHQSGMLLRCQSVLFVMDDPNVTFGAERAWTELLYMQ